MAAGASVMLARLAGRRWLDLLMRGDQQTLHAAVAQLPAARVATDPELALACAASLLEAGEPAAAERHLRRAGEQRADGAGARSAGASRCCYAAAVLHHARVTGDVARAREAAAALHAAPELAELPERDAVRAFAWASLGAAELWSGDIDAAARALGRGARAAARAGHDPLLLTCRALLAFQASLQGRLGACAAAADEALAFSAARGWDGSWPAGAALLAQAGAQLLWNRLGAAEASLARAVEVLATSREAPLRVLLGYSEARRLEALGALDRALQTMQAANDELGDWPLRPELAGVLRAYEELLLAATGEGRARAGAPRRPRRDVPAERARARVAPARGGGAGGRARRARAAVRRRRRPRARVDPDRAVGRRRARRRRAARPRGCGPLAHRGARARRARRLSAPAARPRHGDRADAPARDPRRHAAPGARRRAARRRSRPGARRGPAPKLVADVLSERELMVLRYLPTVLTNSEIAAELFVSVNTVKTHVKSIYRKLDVTERRSAVRRARALRLLAP